MEAMFDELGNLMTEAERIRAESRGKSAQVTLLSEVGRALQSTMEIDQLLRTILVAVTAGDGLGFNRAFLLLVNSTGSAIEGRMAVGPTHASEAEAIWKAMEGEERNLRQMLSSYVSEGTAAGEGIMKTAGDLVLPFDAADNIVAKSLDEGMSFVVEDPWETPAARRIAEVLQNEHFLVVPLVAEGKKLGAIIADNFVTKRKIVDEDVRLLETFASQAALTIMNASLHRDLQRRLEQLQDAH
jgi:GAF domain-containing protein